MTPARLGPVAVDRHGAPFVLGHIVDMEVVEGHVASEREDAIVAAPEYDELVLEEGRGVLRASDWSTTLRFDLLSL